MTTPPVLTKDTEHLRLLVIFHYIVAGFALLGIGFLSLHFLLMKTILGNPAMWKNTPNPPPPELFAIFKWVYLVVGVVLILGGILNLLSASFLRKRRHRLFSLVVAALNCLQIPFGTALGVFTIIILLRDSVQALYDG